MRAIFFLLLAVLLSVAVTAKEADFAHSTIGELEVVAPIATVPGLRHWSGYITLPHKPTCRLFGWIFESEGTAADAPTILFANGGPGASSTSAALHIGGPLRVSKALKLSKNQHSWARLGRFVALLCVQTCMLMLTLSLFLSLSRHVSRFVIIDQPCGTGYGDVQSDSDYANSAAEYTADMVAAMKLVWARAPFLAKGPLIVSGESYAGHYNPHLAAALLKTSDPTMRSLQEQLQRGGMITGNPYVNVGLQALTLPALAGGNGFLSPENLVEFESKCKAVADLARAQDPNAKLQFDEARDWMRERAGGIFEYDWRRTAEPSRFDKEWLKQPEVLRALHVSEDDTRGQEEPVHAHLLRESVETTDDLFLFVSTKIPVAVYYGIFDTMDGISSAFPWTQQIWGTMGQRNLVSESGGVIGIEFPFQSGNATLFNVFGGGHMLGEDTGSPKNNFDMFHTWLARWM